MRQALEFKRELFSALSWRAEARAASMPAYRGQRVRDRVGHLMRWTRAHDSLPDLENRAAILCFHGVISHTVDPDVECEHLPVDRFRQLLRVLNRSFRVISLAELVSCISEHRSPPAKSVVITFDDGYANNAEVAAEELHRFHMPWSAFLPAQLVETGAYQWIDDVRLMVHRGRKSALTLPAGFLTQDSGLTPQGIAPVCPVVAARQEPLTLDLSTPAQRHEAVRTIHQLCRYVPDEVRCTRLDALYNAFPTGMIEDLRNRFRSFAPMTWGQARQLQSAGVDVGSHSLTHTALGAQSQQAIEHEVFAARELLQARLGRQSSHFSYPYGRPASLSQQTEATLVAAGYNSALTLEEDLVRCDRVNLMQLPRLIVSPQIGRMVFGLWQRFLR